MIKAVTKDNRETSNKHIAPARSNNIMKYKLFSAILVLISISLSGCLPANTEYDPEDFIKEKRAIVIMRSYTKREDGKLDNLSTDWVKINSSNKNDSEYSFETNRNHSTFNSTIGMDNYYIHSILPGKYKLNRFIIRGIRKVKSLFGNAEIPADPFKEGFGLKSGEFEFEVRPNEIVYLGDFIFHDLFPYGSIEIKDSYYGAKSFLQNKHPELASKLTKRIMKSPPSAEIEYSRFRKQYLGYGMSSSVDKKDRIND